MVVCVKSWLSCRVRERNGILLSNCARYADEMSVQSRNVGANASCYDAAGRGLGGCSRCSRRRPRSFHYGKLSERLEDGRKKTKTNDVRFRCMSVNVGTMRGRGAEIVETSDRRKADLGLLQETRWKGSDCPR